MRGVLRVCVLSLRQHLHVILDVFAFDAVVRRLGIGTVCGFDEARVKVMAQILDGVTAQTNVEGVSGIGSCLMVIMVIVVVFGAERLLITARHSFVDGLLGCRRDVLVIIDGDWVERLVDVDGHCAFIVFGLRYYLAGFRLERS